MPRSKRRTHPSFASNGTRRNDAGRPGKQPPRPLASDKQMSAQQIHQITTQESVVKSIHHGSEPHLVLPILSNETVNLVPILQLLSANDEKVTSFAYCHPAVHHLSNRRNESGLCGYRCIAMLLSYLRGCGTAHKHRIYETSLPNILEMQEQIEQAWTRGINTDGREEIGLIRGTRKYIGTSEVEALLRHLGVLCSIMAVPFDSASATTAPCDALLQTVDEYFNNISAEDNPLGKPPIFLQRHGHSYIVVGIEKNRQPPMIHGQQRLGLVDPLQPTNLVVFDCAVRVHDALKRLLSRQEEDVTNKSWLMSKYRLGRQDLQRYNRFELLFLTGPETVVST